MSSLVNPHALLCWRAYALYKPGDYYSPIAIKLSPCLKGDFVCVIPPFPFFHIELCDWLYVCVCVLPALDRLSEEAEPQLFVIGKRRRGLCLPIPNH